MMMNIKVGMGRKMRRVQLQMEPTMLGMMMGMLDMMGMIPMMTMMTMMTMLTMMTKLTMLTIMTSNRSPHQMGPRC
jgi:hypothetical protein